MSWPTCRLETLFEEPSRNGVYKPAPFHGSGVKIVNMGELFGYGFIGSQSMSRLRLEPQELLRSELRDGDLLFGRRSLVEAGAGKCSIVQGVTEPTTFESSLIRVRLNDKACNPLFYYYWFLSPYGRGSIRAIVSGTNVKGIRGSDLKNVLVPEIHRDAQTSIASTLNTYDSLIENNRRRIQLLEESARLLYREWFVRLRFPGCEKVRRVDGIPQGWHRVTAADILEIDPSEPLEKGVERQFVPMSALSEVGMQIDGSKCERRMQTSGARFRNGDVLFARITPCLENGKTAFVDFLQEGEVATGSTEFIVLRGRSVSPEFSYCLARTHELREHAKHSMIGASGRQRVQVNAFKKYWLALAPQPVLDQFTSIVQPLFKQIRSLVSANDRLVKARDLLLPKLMSGEVQV